MKASTRVLGMVALAFGAASVPAWADRGQDDDGHYVKLDRLSPGHHTLKFAGVSVGADGVPISLNVTYLLNVVSVPKEARD